MSAPAEPGQSLFSVDSALVAGEPGPDPLYLSIDDLQFDKGGEVVFEGMGSLDVAIVSERQVIESGVIDSNVTQAGVNVAGYLYYRLEGDITLYSSNDLRFVSTAP